MKKMTFTLADEVVHELERAARRLAIAACALSWNAALWTLNASDFHDVPGLRLRGG